MRKTMISVSVLATVFTVFAPEMLFAKQDPSREAPKPQKLETNQSSGKHHTSPPKASHKHHHIPNPMSPYDIKNGVGNTVSEVVSHWKVVPSPLESAHMEAVVMIQVFLYNGTHPSSPYAEIRISKHAPYEVQFKLANSNQWITGNSLSALMKPFQKHSEKHPHHKPNPSSPTDIAEMVSKTLAHGFSTWKSPPKAFEKTYIELGVMAHLFLYNAQNPDAPYTQMTINSQPPYEVLCKSKNSKKWTEVANLSALMKPFQKPLVNQETQVKG